jgi:superfamily II RNA helicase
MNEYRRHASRPRKPYRKSYKPKPRRVVLRPGADQRLKKIFTRIGAPAPTPFKPDPFQLEAIDAMAFSDVLVTAPTGAGKTWIALQAIEKMFNKGRRAWYASPLKALTNAKKDEFGAHFGPSNVGILTGDRKENPDAPIIVGTTEILRNQLYDAMHQGIALATDFVVLDEAHFLGDMERGVVWEEIMIYLPQRIPLLMLSATVGNAHEIANWLISIRNKHCRVIQERSRPVPLYPMLLHPSGTLYPLLVKTGSQGKNRLYKKVVDFLNTRRQQALAPPGQLPPFGDILQILRKYRLLPAIFFLKSRADCDRAIQLCRENQIADPKRADQLNRRIHELADAQPHIERHRQRWGLEHLAVGSHHSGQLPAWKLVLETLMSEGLLDAIFATSTVAAGVDFPARTVGFLNSDRFNGREFMPLDATELQQMTGRAGRRGKDKVGFAMVIPGKYMDVRQVSRLFNAPPAPVHSQIRINFSMALNLLLSHRPSEIKDLLHKSLAAFQQHGAHIDEEGTAHRHLWQDFQRHLAFLHETGFVDNRQRLTEDGLWASHLRIDQPLLVAQGLRQELFPQNDPAMLAAIMAGFVNEKETDEHLDNKRLPKKLIKAVKKVSRGLKGFSKHMQVCGFEVRPLYYRPALYMWAWASGHTWQKVIENGQMAEGDMAMLVLRTADHLRHLKALRHVFGPMAAAAKEAIDLILRDPVMPERPSKAKPQQPEQTSIAKGRGKKK